MDAIRLFESKFTEQVQNGSRIHDFTSYGL